MIRTMLIGSLAGLALLAEPAAAQGRGNSGKVPPGHLPPAGMCRVWIDGVPPGRQPGVTGCATARRDAYRYGSRARVLYGDDYARRGNGKAKGKYKNRDRDDDYRYGDRRERRRDDGTWYDPRVEDRRRSSDRYCVDNNRDGRCDTNTSTTTTRRSGTGVYEAIDSIARAKRRSP